MEWAEEKKRFDFFFSVHVHDYSFNCSNKNFSKLVLSGS